MYILLLSSVCNDSVLTQVSCALQLFGPKRLMRGCLSSMKTKLVGESHFPYLIDKQISL